MTMNRALAVGLLVATSLLGLAVGLLAPSSLSAPAVDTMTVENTDDSGPGSFRVALVNANADPDKDTIVFNIAPGGLKTIAPGSPLPMVTNAVIIDGESQPGDPVGPDIELDGTNAGGAANGLVITAGNSEVSGLAIGNFARNGISLQQQGGNRLTKLNIGTNSAADQNRGNGGEGVNVQSSNNNVLDDLTIVNNADGGSVINSSNNVVTNSRIGTDATMTQNMGNTGAGFGVLNGFNNRFENNVVGFNRFGFVVFSGLGNDFRHNAIDLNTQLGLDNGGDGVDANDRKDRDTGPNGRQNYPVITSAVSDGVRTRVIGVLKSTPRTNFTLDFYCSPFADPSGFGEGRLFLGEIQVRTNRRGRANFDGFVNGDGAVAPGQKLTGTATNEAGTSEFSKAVEVEGTGINECTL